MSRAEGFTDGDEVFGVVTSGAYAQFATASAAAIAKRPAGVSDEQAAAIPVAGLTAWQALFDRGGLERGQTALIAGAAGGVGHFAVQFAKHEGARVIGTGSSRNRDFVLGLGADEYVDYTSQDVGEVVSDVDVAFDTVGGWVLDLFGRVPYRGEKKETDEVTVTVEKVERTRERGQRAELLIMSPRLGAAGADRRAGGGRRRAGGDREIIPLAETRRAHGSASPGTRAGRSSSRSRRSPRQSPLSLR